MNPVDVVGLGLNAMDTLCVLPRLPEPGGKARITDVRTAPGGQIATALVTCSRLGLRTRYIGSVGDDEAGRRQIESLAAEGVDVSGIRVVQDTCSQMGIILIEDTTGERTVCWHRDSRLTFPPDQLQRSVVLSGRALHLDGADGPAALQAARWARDAGIPVMIDIDEIYDDITQQILQNVDYLIAAEGFGDPVDLHRQYKCRVVGVTAGRRGSVFFDGSDVIETPALKVDARDTTGAGDVFHGAFLYGVLQDWPLRQSIRFAHAAASLKCREIGARTGIPTMNEISQALQEMSAS